MNTKSLLLSVFVLTALLVGCKKDKDEDAVDPFQSPYSTLTVEDNKDNLEGTGVELVADFDLLKDATAVEVSISYMELPGTPISDEAAIGFNIPIRIIAGLGNNASPEDVFISLKTVSEDPNSFQDIWDEIEGKYSWNSSIEDWDFTEQDNVIIFEFPGKEGETTNTAVYTVSNFGVVNFTDPIIDFEAEEMEAQLPTSLHADLKYDGTLLASYDFSATYTEDAIPTSLNTTLTVDNFSFVVTLSHTPYTKASAKYQFKNGGTVLIETYFSGEGDWSDENIDANTTEVKEFDYIDFWSGDSIFDYYDETKIEEIVSTGNAYVQVKNIKIAGKVDAQKLGTKIRALDEQYPTWEDQNCTEYATALANAINENSELVVVYADNNQKIAAAEAYVYEDTDYNEWSVDLRFIFGDGSKVDAETYFSEGFSELIDAINDLMQEIANENDLDYDPIEY